MSDLISRQAVIELIESKCIDGCFGTDDTTLIDAHSLVDEVSEIPTAYDVEAVVEKLDKACFSISDDYPGYVIDAEYAVDIVEVGGKE